ncbi:MAG TPA: hypothetical protein VF459_04490 [Caulobacteraceae bacterium]
MRLFHFSDDPAITRFVPRPVTIPTQRPPGTDWLNGPLVWAIDDWHAPMYLFPRDCPRILLWRTPRTSPEDEKRFFDGRGCRMIAHIEWAWFERLRTAQTHRYDLPVAPFEDLSDAGMWISRAPVEPLAMETLTDLPAALRAADVELRVMHSLAPLKGAWETSIHFSGIRLRNAVGWS